MIWFDKIDFLILFKLYVSSCFIVFIYFYFCVCVYMCLFYVLSNVWFSLLYLKKAKSNFNNDFLGNQTHSMSKNHYLYFLQFLYWLYTRYIEFIVCWFKSFTTKNKNSSKYSLDTSLVHIRKKYVSLFIHGRVHERNCCKVFCWNSIPFITETG